MEELIQYVQPTGPLPDLLGSKSGSLLIMCSGACLWDDLAAYHDQHTGDRMAVNDAIAYYPRLYQQTLHHGVSLHTPWLPSWSFEVDYNADYNGYALMQTHSNQKGFPGDKHPSTVWPIHRDGGTSGLFAVLVGLLMGYDRIVLAGCPMDDKGHFWGPQDQRDKEFNYCQDTYRQEWMRARDAVFQGRVKSLSGATAEMLGRP